MPRPLPLPDLIGLCRTLRHYQEAGLGILDVFRIQARKGPVALRAVAAALVADLEDGHDFTKALQRQGQAFPPLFRALAGVGEATGMLPEVLRELEKYYTRQLSLRRQFIARSVWPVAQFVLAVLVLAGMILVLGLIGQRHPGAPAFDPLGLGLSGPRGALLFLGAIGGTLALLAGAFLAARRLAASGGGVDTALLGLPAIGPCLRSLALARFCLALGLTLETALALPKALRLSLRATGNDAFAAAEDRVNARIRAGDELTEALAGTGLFPEEFLHVLAVGEESGQLPEVLHRQADHYHEEAGRRLAILSTLAGHALWAAVAILIIFAIFRIATAYVNLLG